MIIDRKGFISLQVIIQGTLCFLKIRFPLKLEQMINSCRCPSCDDQNLLQTELKIGPSSRLWDGLHLDQLESLQGHLTEGSTKEGRNRKTKVGTAYHPSMNATYRRMMKDLIVVFNDVAKKHNVTYFLYGGSLIGSYRHHGMIPWDDDVDIAVYEKHKPNLKVAFSSLSKTFKGIVTNYRWKLAYRHLPLIRKGISWSYPFLDISFFRLTSDKVSDADTPWADRGFRYKICDVFPLVERPFWDLWLPAPRRTDAILKATYDLDMCVSSSYSHSLEIYLEQSFSVSCNTLREYYPFVVRRTVNGTVEAEQLMLNNSFIQTVMVKK